MRTILIYNIRYDLQQHHLEELNRTFFVNAGQSDAYPLSIIKIETEENDPEALETLLSEHITNTTGWCHKGFDYAFIVQ